MPKAKVFLTRRLPDIDFQKLEQIAEVETWNQRQPPPYSVLLEKVQKIDGLLCLLTDPSEANNPQGRAAQICSQ